MTDTNEDYPILNPVGLAVRRRRAHEQHGYWPVIPSAVPATFDGTRYHYHFCPDCPANKAVYEHASRSMMGCSNYTDRCPGHHVEFLYGKSV